MRKEKTLDVGCGASKKLGSIGIDALNLPGVDIVHDLEQYPWPFKEGEFDTVLAHNSIEHLSDTVKVFREIHRVLRRGGIFHFEVPHFTACDMYKDPTHRSFYSYDTAGYFAPEDPLFKFSYAPDVRFEIIQRRILFWGTRKILDKPQEFIFNKIPHLYERKLCWIFPAYQLAVDLKKI